MKPVVHFEIPADEPEKAVNFYKDVFGWNIQRWGPHEYWLCGTHEKNTPGVDGAIMKKKHPDQPVVCTIEVDDIDKFIKLIPQKGGTIVVQKGPIPTVGWLAYFKDTAGNIFGIMQNDKNAK